LYLARIVLNHPNPWTLTLQHFSTYSSEVLQEVLTLLSRSLKEASGKQNSVFKKYASSKYMRVSMLSEIAVYITRSP
jgi:Cyclin, C-terminal domain